MDKSVCIIVSCGTTFLATSVFIYRSRKIDEACMLVCTLNRLDMHSLFAIKLCAFMTLPSSSTIHACMHTYIHGYMHACMHTWIHAYTHVYACIHAYVCMLIIVGVYIYNYYIFVIYSSLAFNR